MTGLKRMGGSPPSKGTRTDPGELGENKGEANLTGIGKKKKKDFYTRERLEHKLFQKSTLFPQLMEGPDG